MSDDIKAEERVYIPSRDDLLGMAANYRKAKAGGTRMHQVIAAEMAYELANAYVAELAAREAAEAELALSIDQAYIASLCGFGVAWQTSDLVCSMTIGGPPVSVTLHSDGKVDVAVNGIPCPGVKTRGQFQDLLSALGITKGGA